jgi:acetylornithine deacetylase/succinyl-diaminopimelate desuccinylase-like protein
MRDTGPGDKVILGHARAARGWGEPGYSLYERTTIRPALTINGIVGGYQGEGSKAVIPARALAKINIRLVPDQDPREVEAIVRNHIARITPSTVQSNVRTLLAARPALLNRSHPAMRAAARAYVRGFGRAPVFLRSGGTIPVVNTFQQVLGIPTVLMGFALPDDRIHAPNEKFHLPNLYKGVVTCIAFLAEMGRRKIEMSAFAQRTARLPFQEMTTAI